MRRSVLLEVVVHCPHLGRTVAATRNQVIDRLVACSHAAQCRDPDPQPGAPEPARPFPRGCAVYPSLAK
ncbi:MAG TPA: hypothetical protein VMT03_07750 [Polyangia bacterium]|nr:hypothetical protein [Polyangia bacterium]